MGEQGADGAAVQVDPAVLAVAGLRRPDDQPPPGAYDLLADGQPPALEVDVLPPQADRLAPSQAAQRHELEQREHSCAHARVAWPDGAVREGWFRTGDAQDSTVSTATLVTTRLLEGLASPGAYTPAAALGPDLAVSAGGTFLLD